MARRNRAGPVVWSNVCCIYIQNSRRYFKA